MRVRFAPRAADQARRAKLWWRQNRPAAPDLFDTELRQVLEHIAAAPDVGIVYGTRRRAGAVRRVLLPEASKHVYYVVIRGEVVVLSVWGAQRKRGPKL